MNKRKDFLVHDEGELTREGDIVRIESTRPISTRKNFAVAEIKNPKGRIFEKYRDITKYEEEYYEFLQKKKNVQSVADIPLDDNWLPIESSLTEGLPEKFTPDILQIIHRHNARKEDFEKEVFANASLSTDKGFRASVRAFTLLKAMKNTQIADASVLKEIKKEIESEYALQKPLEQYIKGPAAMAAALAEDYKRLAEEQMGLHKPELSAPTDN